MTLCLLPCCRWQNGTFETVFLLPIRLWHPLFSALLGGPVLHSKRRSWVFLLNSFAACKVPSQNWSSGRVEVCVESKTELFLPVPFFLLPSSFLSFFFLDFQNRMLQLPGAVRNRWRINHMPIDEGYGTQKYFKSRTVPSGALFWPNSEDDQVWKCPGWGT